ncbi:MAG TPA: RES family NAD+ phosphorylase [Verrucomicrobiae bacterium]
MIRSGWRIVPAEKAAAAFDGEGARSFGGRWNPEGVPMIYGSEHQSLAALEVRVHIDKTSLGKRYKGIAFHFDENLMKIFSFRDLPKNWREEPPPRALQEIGASWVKAAESVILAVPSVIIPTELNFLINPRHPKFTKIKIGEATDFAFDQRLFA